MLTPAGSDDDGGVDGDTTDAAGGDTMDGDGG
jgi:hypothetical protein